MMNFHDLVRRLVKGGSICLILILSVACSKRVQIVTNLVEYDANEVYSVLLNAGMSATKSMNKSQLSSIAVDDNEVSVALDLLRSRGLPRMKFEGLGAVFKREGMVSSPVEERARYLHALSEEIARTLSYIDGVITSRVHLVLPEHNAFTEISTPSSAAVFIKYQKSYNLDILQTQMKKMVANSIPGLSTDHVSMVLVPGEDYSKAMSAHMTNVLGVQVEDNSTSQLFMIMAILGVVTILSLMFGINMYIRSHRKTN